MQIPKEKYPCSALIFDLDGTISDPSVGIAACFSYALTKRGYPDVSREWIEREIGPPLDDTFRKLVPGAGADEVTALVGCYRERYAADGYAQNTLYPGIAEALAALHATGTSLGICTSKRADFAQRILKMFGLRDYFEFVSGGDIGISKSTQLADLLADGVIDRQAIMIGDRAIDIESARKNAMRGVAVSWGFGDTLELEGAFPVCIIDRVEDLLDITL